MQRFFILRRLVGSDLGWFAVPRRRGRARGRQRGINFNVEVLELVFGGIPESTTIPVQTVRHSDGKKQRRSIKKQQKNWRLVGDMVWGEGLDSVDKGDFFWCIVELADQSEPILTWDVVSREQQPDPHASIAQEFGPQLTGSMGVWNAGEEDAERLLSLLGLEALGKEISNPTEERTSSAIDTQHSDKPLRTGSSALRPRARLVQAIGQDLISNEIVALVELIKNAYDADAHSVEISFEPPLRPGEGAILVRDDGHGMSLDVLQKAWMEPATVSKARRRFSPGGRRMTGEKGLGRFAAARLAKRLRLDSVARDSGNRIVADFDWEDFRREDRFLDQVQCKWMEFKAPDSSPGTTLTLSELRDEWDFEAFRRLRAELSRLLVQRSAADSFEINLSLPPLFAALSGPLTPPPVLSRPHYTLQGRMSQDGKLAAELSIGNTKQPIKGRISLKGGRVPSCGPFSFDFKVWDRDELERLALDLGSTISELRRDLNEAAGVSIYRDSFRVLPYGSAANDWLRLDLRRVQNPTMRLSNNQIVGAIYINADENPELRDQTNREGIVDSPAFTDLKACVGELLTHIEKPRYDLRRKADKLTGQKNLFDELTLAPVRAAFEKKYPGDREFIDYLEEKDRRVKESVEQIQEVIVRYRRLATLGQLVDVVLHDGRTPIASITNQCELGHRDIKKADFTELRTKLSSRLDTIATQATALSSLLNRISPFGGRKRSRPQDYLLEDLISNAFTLFHERIDNLNVEVELPTTSTLIRVDATEIQQIIVNLLDNALYWLEKVPQEKRKIVVQVDNRNDEIELLFSDSGPGVSGDVRHLIFDPYFSARPDGVGLGLTIAGEIVSEYNGTLELIEPGLLSGANFRVTLRKRS